MPVARPSTLRLPPSLSLRPASPFPRLYSLSLRPASPFPRLSAGGVQPSCPSILTHVNSRPAASRQVASILAACAAADPPIPVVYALSRKGLGRAIGRPAKVSAVGFLTFETLKGLQVRALELAAELRASWAARLAAGGAPAHPPDEAACLPVPKAALRASAREWAPPA